MFFFFSKICFPANLTAANCDCPRPCTFTLYESTMSASQIPSKVSAELLRRITNQSSSPELRYCCLLLMLMFGWIFFSKNRIGAKMIVLEDKTVIRAKKIMVSEDPVSLHHVALRNKLLSSYSLVKGSKLSCASLSRKLFPRFLLEFKETTEIHS